MTKRKILFIHASAILGGTELRSYQIASQLSSSFDFAVLFHGHSGSMSERYTRIGIPFWTVPFPRLLPAVAKIKKFQPDIVHIFGLKTNILWRPLLYFLGYRNLIGHIAGLTNVGEGPSWLRIRVDLWTQRFLKIYLTNSQIVADRLVAYGFPREKLRTIHNGVEIPDALAPKQTRDTPVIISVGNLRPVKGQRFFIETLKRLLDKKLPFKALLVGDGPDREALFRQTQTLGLNERLQFMGEMENKDLLSLLNNVDIFALFSLSEGISGAAMEAMAHGVPVVATNVGGMSELIQSGEEGYLFPVREIDQAAEHLASLLSQPSRRLSMGEKAYLKVKSQFNLQTTLREYEKLYASI
jgi:glycosyltransferase involved in cell wall biosynthesis